MCDIYRGGISVVVPVYNGEETLNQCLTAITAQEGYDLGRNYEVIVVDDGSTDNTAEIANKFSVQVISLGTNMGRIVARETGARAARFDRLLLLDSRVVASRALMSTYSRLGKVICMAGDLGEKEAAKEAAVDKLYFCLRKKYYRNHFPQQNRLLEVAKSNFSEVPKGTTCIFIDKNTFLEVIPDDKGKTVNDDTKLLRDIVFNHQEHLYRSLDLKVRYLHRRNLSSQAGWLIGRGVLFADYLLTQKFDYLMAYLASLLVIPLLMYSFWISTLVAAIVLAVMLVLYLVLVAHIAETLSDFVTFVPLILTISFLFWLGVNKGVATRCRRRLFSLLRMQNAQS